MDTSFISSVCIQMPGVKYFLYSCTVTSSSKLRSVLTYSVQMTVYKMVTGHDKKNNKQEI